jgi:CRISPR/Cas system-associated exonuclease Cas4 (RecB family)
MIQQAPGAGDYELAKDTEQEDRYLPARMINEVVYCPRLFYLMHVEGQFEHNAETTDGEGVHRRVDARTDALAAPPRRDQDDAGSDAAQQQLLFDGVTDEVEATTKRTACRVRENADRRAARLRHQPALSQNV